MDRVFISSVMRDYSDERLAAKDAVESLGLRAVMAETAAASADPAKSALLSGVERADAVVLLLAGRYGYIGDNGLSPTEDEYNHAVKTGKPVLVFVQEGVEREPAQEAFIARVRGSWEQGVSTASFSSPAQLTLAVVKALMELRDTELRESLVRGESTHTGTNVRQRMGPRVPSWTRGLRDSRTFLAMVLVILAAGALLVVWKPWDPVVHVNHPVCSDGRDNDEDGKTDHPADPDCSSPNDPSEKNVPCSDGRDNDEDGETDYPADRGCSSPDDGSEKQ